jgi:hypothetical protein
MKERRSQLTGVRKIVVLARSVRLKLISGTVGVAVSSGVVVLI